MAIRRTFSMPSSIDQDMYDAVQDYQRPEPDARSSSSTSGCARVRRRLPALGSASAPRLSQVDRSQLPMGVSSSMASRMRLDAKMNPNMLNMRMNNQNLKNEFLVHNGKIVSNQFALMKPRPAPGLRPKLEPPSCLSMEQIKRIERRLLLAKKREAQQAQEAEDATRLLQERSELQDDFEDDEGSDETPARAGQGSPAGGVGGDAEHGKESAEVAAESEMNRLVANLMKSEDGRLEQVHSAMADPTLGGLRRDRVHRALCAMGHAKMNKGEIEMLVKEADPKGSVLTLEDFARVVVLSERRRTKQLLEKFQELDEDNTGDVSGAEFRHLVWERGFSVSLDSMEEIVAEVAGKRGASLDFAGFVRAVSIIEERHGFTIQEAEELYELFDKYDDDKSGEMGADELASALGFFGAPTSLKQAQRIVRAFDDDGSGTLARAEFLRVMRMRLEHEIAELRRLFAQYDENKTGFIERGELLKMIKGIGYTIMNEVVDEIVGETVCAANRDKLVFEDILNVLYTVRRREGFAKAEAAELQEVFNKHDTLGEGEIREFELARAMNWLGYPLSHQRRRVLWCQVDVDKTDSISYKEFLKLIRLLREEETLAAEHLLETAKANDDAGKFVRESGMRSMLNKLGYAPPQAMLAQALKQSVDTTGDGNMDLNGILCMLRTIREGQVVRLRQCAGLPDHLASKVRSKFGLRVEAGKKVEPQEVERFMYDVFKTARHQESERERIKGLIKDQSTDGLLDLEQLFWVVRLYGDMQAEDVWKREQEAAEAAGFSPAQVAQFRQAFVTADSDGSGVLTGREIQEVLDEMLALSGLQVQKLRQELMELGGASECVDFPEFLRLMRVVTVGNDGK
eukprot:TRINITY_DN13988_c0_g1_i1.p1 TRINITY_DN13988_c0_g1~~TRINITY_DN13988_c0_g1_i1.p1  ORF type:complete len:884 (+),score=226.78 TRINITY_DN13988_c0_g1_i1:86-2653(+)